MQKVLEGANIKLSSMATDITGVSGRAMITALINGVDDPQLIAQFAKRSMKKKVHELEQALKGLTGTHQRMMLPTQLRHIEFLEAEIERLDQEIKERMRPFQEDLELLDTMPVNYIFAAVFVLSS